MMKYKPNENFTPEQKDATLKKDNNIIVSAGAGSGKTTVLKDRVLRILLDDYFKDGRKVHINNLIILTFTKNAANEMKERIRKIINEHDEIVDEAELLESAYITTFDSYASSLVKKYNYLLDIEKNFTIIDDPLLNINVEKILDNILDKKYANPSKEFTNLIEYFTTKDDTTLRNYILAIYNKGIINVLNKDTYLNEYIDKRYSDEFVNNTFDKLMDELFRRRDDILDLYDLLCDETDDIDKLEENNQKIDGFRNASTYDELAQTIGFSLAQARGNTYTDKGKKYKEQISKIKSAMSKDLYETEKFLKDEYLSTKEYANEIIDIIKKLDKSVLEYKKSINAYSFHDIAFKAIELVKNNKDVAEEIKNNTYEIMIDEYQDTNDIQEEFIKYISNNNVYMVGDIKQSIYRFRNANPYIFKDKYDSYIDESKGIRIDLNKNFRSRNEVVNNINSIFDEIMFDNIGGANYKQEHEMVFGNTSFDKVKDDNQNYNMQILSYDKDNLKGFTEEETEAFIIAKDILKKINSNTKVFDNNELRPCTYKDFCILVDNGNNFDLLKKVLEFFGIPVSIDKATSIKEDDEIFILKNIISLLINIKNNKYETDFKHSFLSVSRSYVYKTSDDELFNIFVNNSYKETQLYKLCLNIVDRMDSLSNKELLEFIVEKFNIINKLQTVGDINERLTRLEYFINNAKSLNEYGMDLNLINDYFDQVLNSKEKVEMTRSKAKSNSVKIMTIHGSKGLEFNYVYMPYLDTDYFKNATVKNWFFDKEYGIIVPFYNDGVGSTFVKNLVNKKERLETLSEKIRLLYVAVTRPIEQFTLITYHSEKDKEVDDVINYSNLSECNSYRNILRLLENKLHSFYKEVDLDELELTKDYNIAKDNNYLDIIEDGNKTIEVNHIVIDSKELDNKHFSKALKKVIDNDLRQLLDFGTMMHYCFEVYDFNHDNLDELNISNEYKENIKNFLKHEEVKNISNANTYKEHEIKFNRDGSTFHGFIDLLVEYEDHFDIIDYKLSNVDSEEYVNQLNGYKEYIESTYNKPCNMYLYSIKKDIFKKL